MMQISETKNVPFSVSKIATSPPTLSQGFRKTLISLDAEATFLSIGTFLENLEDSPLLTEIDSIEIKRQAGDLKLCNAKIKIFSYVAEP